MPGPLSATTERQATADDESGLIKVPPGARGGRGAAPRERRRTRVDGDPGADQRSGKTDSATEDGRSGPWSSSTSTARSSDGASGSLPVPGLRTYRGWAPEET